MCARNIEPINQPKYVEECCQALLDDVQYPSDRTAVHLVRLHRVASQIAQGLCADGWDHPLGLNSAPIGAYVKVLESELSLLKDSPSEGTSQRSESTTGQTSQN